jgi:hypothetical protein
MWPISACFKTHVFFEFEFWFKQTKTHPSTILNSRCRGADIDQSLCFFFGQTKILKTLSSFFFGRERRRGHGFLVQVFSGPKGHLPVTDFFWNKVNREGV